MLKHVIIHDIPTVDMQVDFSPNPCPVFRGVEIPVKRIVTAAIQLPFQELYYRIENEISKTHSD